MSNTTLLIIYAIGMAVMTVIGWSTGHLMMALGIVGTHAVIVTVFGISQFIKWIFERR